MGARGILLLFTKQERRIPAIRAAWEEEAHTAGRPSFPSAHSCCSLLGGLGQLGVQATSLPVFLEAWLLLNKPGQICSTLARAIYSGKTIPIFKMYLLFRLFPLN